MQSCFLRLTPFRNRLANLSIEKNKEYIQHHSAKAQQSVARSLRRQIFFENRVMLLFASYSTQSHPAVCDRQAYLFKSDNQSVKKAGFATVDIFGFRS